MTSKPLFSIILPTFNQVHFLRRNLKYALNQTYKNFELIIIDNHSSDETNKYINKIKDSRIRYFKYKNYGNLAKARNFAIQISKGVLIAFLDSDDYWDKFKLEKVKKIFDKFKPDIIHHPMYGYGKNFEVKILKDKNQEINKPIYDNLIINGNSIIQSSVVVTKNILIKVKKISENKNKFAWEDYDTWLKISKITNNFYFIKEVLGYCYIGEGTISSITRTNFIINKFRKIYKKEILEVMKRNKINEKDLWWIQYNKLIYFVKKNLNLKSKIEVNFFKIPNFLKIKFFYFWIYFQLKKIKKIIMKYFNSVILYSLEYKKINMNENIKFHKITKLEELNKVLKVDYDISLYDERLKKKNIFYCITNSNNNLLASGWASTSGKFYISEVDKEIYLQHKQRMLFDFYVPISQRGNQYYSVLLSKIIKNKINKYFIFAIDKNLRSIKGILNSGGKFIKKINFLYNEK